MIRKRQKPGEAGNVQIGGKNPSVKIELSSIRHHFKDDPELWARFSEFPARCENVDLDQFFTEIDASDYSILDWAEALLEFEKWLNVNQIKKKDFVSMLGYCSCCTMMLSDSVEKPSLKLIVSQCLTEYGFDAAKSSQD